MVQVRTGAPSPTDRHRRAWLAAKKWMAWKAPDSWSWWREGERLVARWEMGHTWGEVDFELNGGRVGARRRRKRRT